MWAQRRGAAALIVGDDTPGGPLLIMYARGDTSNVTIPSLFTSHTTAHLLSTLIPSDGPTSKSGSRDSSQSRQGNGNPGRVTWKDGDIEAKKLEDARGNFNLAKGSKPATWTQSNLADSRTERGRTQKSDRAGRRDGDSGWLHYLLSGTGFGTRSHAADLSAESRRPPSSGRLDWTDDGSDDGRPKAPGHDRKPDSAIVRHNADAKGGNLASPRGPADDFIIGVHDWRDKDLVAASSSSDDDNHWTDMASRKPKSAVPVEEKPNGVADTLAGGIITPGSGEYERTSPDVPAKDTSAGADSVEGVAKGAEDSRTWLSQMLHGEEDGDRITPELRTSTSAHGLAVQQAQDLLTIKKQHVPDSQNREGLWVTLTPTTLSTSPFLDTLLVLVVSPLITLTVVYALLLLRSRIRRRRWRAPKSVVDRLPVRTYHTMSCSSTSSPVPSATPPATSPTSPLLQTSFPSPSPCPRTRSPTRSIRHGAVGALPEQDAAMGPHQPPGKRTRPPGGKKKYIGKQIECVVCLEEYVDGHSRVMSLPCGHEFHAECMYVD